MKHMELLKNINDKRKGKNDVVIFSPVGDLGQMKDFVEFIKEKGLDKGHDFLFIYRDGLEEYKTNLSAIHAYEKYPLGTSGAFFTGQAYSYMLGYKYIVVTDLDAFIDSKDTFNKLLEIAKEKGIAVSPASKSPDNLQNEFLSNVNQWSVYPRHVFEKAGFSIPYVWKGGEDYEFRHRLRMKNQIMVFKEGRVFHPMTGFTVYHKMLGKRKQYPYVNGITKAFLFISKYDKRSYFRFVLWYLFYSYVADVFGDKQLKEVISKSHKFVILNKIVDGGKQYISIEKIKDKAAYSNTSPFRAFLLPISLVHLLLFKKYEVFTDRITLQISRTELFLRMLKGALLVPIRFVNALTKILGWGAELKKVVFPITPDNSEDAAKVYARLLDSKEL